MTTLTRDAIDDLVDWQLENRYMDDTYTRQMVEEIEDHPSDMRCPCENAEGKDWVGTSGAAMRWVPGYGVVDPGLWRVFDPEEYRRYTEQNDD